MEAVKSEAVCNNVWANGGPGSIRFSTALLGYQLLW